MSTSTLERADHDLVAAVRYGDERAFEALYARYHRRINAFVYGMVKDHGRAEDVTQEVFVSALRRIQATERPIAFKPWIYEIAKNACIDAFRRSRRAEEVSYDAADGLTPSDRRRLAGGDATPDAAVAAKQELETLCGAFGGLSDAHHEILVMRELEGLSYHEIGERMGMSRPAVESTLFRARRRLTEEYGELVSGERCRRVRRIIAVAAEGRLGVRDARRLARHVAHCQPCRREALASGLDRSLIARPPVRRRIAEKVGAWLPLPGFLRGHLSALSGSSKVAAGAAVLAAGVGAGVGVEQRFLDRAPAQPAHVGAPPVASHGAATGARPVTAPAARAPGQQGARKLRRASRHRASTGPARHVARRGGTRSGVAPSPAGAASAPGSAPPARSAPKPAGTAAPTRDPVNTVQQTVSGARNTVSGVGNAVSGAGNAVSGATNTVQGVANQAGQTVQGTVDQAGQTVQGTVDQAGQTVQGTVDQAGQTVQGTVDQAGQTVQGTVDQAGQTVQGTVDQAGQTVQDATGAVGGVVGGVPSP